MKRKRTNQSTTNPKRGFLSCNVPLVVIDRCIDDPKTDVWLFLHSQAPKRFIRGHFFCDGAMNSRQRISERYSNFYLSEYERHPTYPHFSRSGFKEEFAFVWTSRCKIVQVIDSIALLKKIHELITSVTRLTGCCAALTLDYALPYSLFLPFRRFLARRNEEHERFCMGDGIANNDVAKLNSQTLIDELSKEQWIGSTGESIHFEDWIKQYAPAYRSPWLKEE
jgi:hypothetical protein